METNNNFIDECIERAVRSTIRKFISEETASPKKRTISPEEINRIFKLDSIPIEVLKTTYMDLAMHTNIGGFGDMFQLWDGKILKEDKVRRTISPEETKSALMRQTGLRDWQIQTENAANGLTIMIIYPELNRNTEIITDAMSACGWSVGTANGVVVKYGVTWRVMTFDPMFQEIITNDIRSKFTHIYHWTPLRNLEPILKNGLEPRSENSKFSYSSRIHFMSNISDFDKALYLGQQLYNANQSKNNDGRYVLVSVELKKISPFIKFYYDPRYETGIYTTEPIPADAIEVVYGYDFRRHQAFAI